MGNIVECSVFLLLCWTAGTGGDSYIARVLMERIVAASSGSDYGEGDRCHIELEDQLDYAISLIHDEVVPDEALFMLKDVLERKESLEKIFDTYITFCNRSRLMVCDTEIYRCVCAPNTQHRVMQRYKVPSHFCYLTSGPCDADPAMTIPMLPNQMRNIRFHYGDPLVHFESRSKCLRNLCVKLNKEERICEGN